MEACNVHRRNMLRLGLAAMKALASGLAKCAVAMAVITATLYHAELWAWVSSMSVAERSEFVIGFALKILMLAIISFCVATLPHYIKPYLELLRLGGVAKVKNYRKGVKAPAVRSTRQNPRENYATQLLTRLLFKQDMYQYNRQQRQNNPRDEIRLKW